MSKVYKSPPSGLSIIATFSGLMMRYKDRYVVAVRCADGSIKEKIQTFNTPFVSSRLLQTPFIRGFFSFIEYMYLTIYCLVLSENIPVIVENTSQRARFNPEKSEKEAGLKNDSGEKVPKTDEEESGKKAASKKISSDTVKLRRTVNSVSYNMAFAAGLVLCTGIFIFLPLGFDFLVSLFVRSITLKSILNGIIRLLIVLATVFAISRFSVVQRMRRYHGAGYKCLNCIEEGRELTVDNVRESSMYNVRCGLSFILYTFALSFILFFAVNIESIVLRIVIRAVLFILITSVCYEIMRVRENHDNSFTRAVSSPGYAFQRMVSIEPDDEMIEVGIEAVYSIFDWEKYIDDIFGKKIEKISTPESQSEDEYFEEYDEDFDEEYDLDSDDDFDEDI